MSEATDPVTAYLAEVGKHAARVGEFGAKPGPYLASAAHSIVTRDVPRLLAAVEAVLARHKPGRFVVLGELCEHHENHRYFSITAPEAADLNACPSCTGTARVSCDGCGSGLALDRCPDRLAITRELLGEDGLVTSNLEAECPGCNADDPADFRDGCENTWHVEARDALLGEDSTGGDGS